MTTKLFLRFSILVFLSCFALSVQSQNWSVFPANTSKLYFEDTAGYLYTLKIDTSYSTSNQRTIQLVPAMETRWSSTSLWCDGTPFGGILTGKTIVETNSLIELHFAAGVVPIPLQASSQSFTFEGETLTMNRISKRDTLLGGAADSIMEFKVTTSATLFLNCFNYGSIILSKNHGLLTSIGCFSKAPNVNAYEMPVGHVFRSAPEMQASKVWDFNVGDQFHFLDEYYSGSFNYHTFSNYEITSKIVTTTDYVYTVDFVMERVGKSDSSGTTTWTKPMQFVIADSVTYRMKAPIVFQGRNIYYLWGNNWKSTQRPHYLELEGLPLMTNDSCLLYTPLDPKLNTVEYVEGLGKVLDYYSGYDTGQNFANGQRLVFYKKGTETWGNAHYVGLTENTVLYNPIYPNPVAKTLNIESLENTTALAWHINTSTGQKIVEGFLQVGQTKINVAHLPKGIYFLALQNGGAYRFVKD